MHVKYLGDTLKTVAARGLTNKQTDKQTDKQTNKTTNILPKTEFSKVTNK